MKFWIISIICWALAATFALLSYYAFTESQSTGWGVGYAVAAVLVIGARWGLAGRGLRR